jgi:hypothetical protein
MGRPIAAGTFVTPEGCAAAIQEAGGLRRTALDAAEAEGGTLRRVRRLRTSTSSRSGDAKENARRANYPAPLFPDLADLESGCRLRCAARMHVYTIALLASFIVTAQSRSRNP